ncbi:hypothetical protein [Streptacidiphilus sp. EB103A]|uniref:hypothetical protein n=1 Tax=Streptacidiphilus sp. EB103A TaxID=3156275 RepID=UPI00351334AF
MVIGLYAVGLLLVAAVAVDLSLTLAVIQRLRALEVSRAGSRTEHAPKIGHTVEAFTTTSLVDRPITLDDVAMGERTVVFFMVGCAPCAALIESLVAGASLGDPNPIFFVVGKPDSPEAHEIGERLRGLGEIVLLGDRDRGVLDAFGGVASFPRIVRLQGGVVRESESAPARLTSWRADGAAASVVTA